MLVKANEEEENGAAQHPDCVKGSVAPGPASEGGSEAFPHRACVSVVSAESMRQEVNEGITHQSAHSQRD